MESSTTSQSNEPTLKFKGVWIPYEIWEGNAATDPVRALTWVEKILWSIISAYGKKGDPCYASNEWLADRLGTTAARVANAISVLRKSGFITDDGFDGRRKFRLAVIPHEPVQKPVESVAEVKAALTQELMLPKPQSLPSLNAGVNPEASPNKTEGKGEGGACLKVNGNGSGKQLPYQMKLPEEAVRWNSVCGRISKVQAMGDSRMRHLRTRRQDEFWKAHFDAALAKISKSKFCRGENDRGWRASFDWLIERSDALAKVIECKYDDRESKFI